MPSSREPAPAPARSSTRAEDTLSALLARAVLSRRLDVARDPFGVTAQELNGCRGRAASRRLQRLAAEEIKSCFAETWASNCDDVTAEVIEAIVAQTTAWEAGGRDWSRSERRSTMKQALTLALEQAYRQSEIPRPSDADYWTTWVAEHVIKRLEPKAMAEQEPLAIPSGLVGSPLERTVIHCTMGQGVVADLGKYRLFSNQFMQCSPIVMFSNRTGVGGLFHYAALADSQLVEIKQMFDMVKPTVIYLNKPTKTVDYSGALELRDFNRRVQQRLRHRRKARLTHAKYRRIKPADLAALHASGAGFVMAAFNRRVYRSRCARVATLGLGETEWYAEHGAALDGYQTWRATFPAAKARRQSASQVPVAGCTRTIWSSTMSSDTS